MAALTNGQELKSAGSSCRKPDSCKKPKKCKPCDPCDDDGDCEPDCLLGCSNRAFYVKPATVRGDAAIFVVLCVVLVFFIIAVLASLIMWIRSLVLGTAQSMGGMGSAALLFAIAVLLVLFRWERAAYLQNRCCFPKKKCDDDC